jgi:hypothetical protein
LAEWDLSPQAALVLLLEAQAARSTAGKPNAAPLPTMGWRSWCASDPGSCSRCCSASHRGHSIVVSAALNPERRRNCWESDVTQSKMEDVLKAMSLPRKLWDGTSKSLIELGYSRIGIDECAVICLPQVAMRPPRASGWC